MSTGFMRRARTFASIATLALAASGCELPLEECTLRACGPILVVHVEGLEDAEYLSAAVELEDGEVLGLYCPNNVECVSDIRLNDVRPERFTIHITVGDSTYARAYEVSYRTYYPNGSSCGPRCRQAEVTFTVE